MSILAVRAFQDLSTYLNESCKNIFETTPFKVFHVRRTYKDGSVIWIVNDDSYIREYVEKDLPLQRVPYEHPSHVTGSKQGVYIWEESLPIINKSLTFERLQLISGISLYDEHEQYCDVIGFGLPTGVHINVFSFYANVLPRLWVFKKEWLLNHEDILNQLYNKNFVLKVQNPARQLIRKEFLKQVNKSQLILNIFDENVKLTPSESILIQLIQHGATIHHMREILHKSLPSLNRSLDGLKTKLGRPFHEFQKIIIGSDNHFNSLKSIHGNPINI